MQSIYAGEPASDLPHGLIHLLSRADMAIWQFITQKTSAIGGITGMQASVLLLLACRHSATSVDLAREYKMYPSAITRLVDRLVSRDLVKRVPCERDRRVIYIQATRKGKEIASQLPSAFDQSYVVLLDGMDESDIDAFRRCLRHILLNARAAEELGNLSGNQESPI